MTNRTRNDSVSSNNQKPSRRKNMGRIIIRALFAVAVFLQSVFLFISQGRLQDSVLPRALSNLTEQPNQLRGQNTNHMVDITVVILTYKKHTALAKLLPSLLYQKNANFEVVVVDNGCLAETKQIVHESFEEHASAGNKRIPLQYLELCDNPGYAAGNNAGAKLASPASKYYLFMNDDIVLSSPNFVDNMKQLRDRQANAGAVGCKIVNEQGTELIEAGSIVFRDGSAAGYGRGSTDINAPRFSYPKPVDYVSGACLLVDKQVFMGYNVEHELGFDGNHFPNYYEDTDLQLHIQHDLRKEVWLQPNAVAKHEEHGSFGNQDSQKLMQDASKVFYAKWKDALEAKHLENPYSLSEEAKAKVFFQASDLRARDPSKASILYIDGLAPNKARGSGFGRAFDNLESLANLGHRVTLATLEPPTRREWCPEPCMKDIYGLGIEYATEGVNDVLETRVGFYDIVIVSRPETLLAVKDALQDFYMKHPFAFVYDCEALAYRREETMYKLIRENGIEFPGGPQQKDEPPELWETISNIELKNKKKRELDLIASADIVIPVSEAEGSLIGELVPSAKETITVGHGMISDTLVFKNSFEGRNGILFLGSFHGRMYYNGDAIWYFLTETYPLIVKENPIPLTIAGRGIPKMLRDVVKKNKQIQDLVRFVESPESIEDIMNTHRIFIAPHLYAAGVQYKVVEALSVGIPVVMSQLTYDSFGSIPGCVGKDPQSFKRCVLEVHNKKKKWAELQTKGIDYIKDTQSREVISKQWTNVINSGLAIARRRNEAFAKGEEFYRENYKGAYKFVNRGHFMSGFDHFVTRGQENGKEYPGMDELMHNMFALDLSKGDPAEGCPEGEELYFSMYPDIVDHLKSKNKSAYWHYKVSGRKEGRQYMCSTT